MLAFLCFFMFLGCAAQQEAAVATSAPSLPPVSTQVVDFSTAAPTPTPTPEPTPEPTPVPPLSGVIIGLDPGHQLIYDPKGEPVAPDSDEKKARVSGGARGVKSKALEYDIVLSVGLELRDLLEAAGATVYMTRTTNEVNISNKERAEFFNEHMVDLGLRIHCNRSSDEKKNGAYILIPSERRTDWFEENRQAALTVIEHYCNTTGIAMAYESGYNTRSDQTGFNWCTRPIITIEMGYLSNVNDDALLSDPAFQKIMARGLYEGILAHFTQGKE